eukprot:TRINITY_DN2092_c1_g1_i2.p1 TRINITY_DN2092_c1_g1~~TRINITY_DN2092_c1_g1_i2.p1  ORF type:complete len:839 (+),score=178.63 TRINITY_DN2092_c1_g1_i2:82-2598(+)
MEEELEEVKCRLKQVLVLDSNQCRQQLVDFCTDPRKRFLVTALLLSLYQDTTGSWLPSLVLTPQLFAHLAVGLLDEEIDQILELTLDSKIDTNTNTHNTNTKKINTNTSTELLIRQPLSESLLQLLLAMSEEGNKQKNAREPLYRTRLFNPRYAESHVWREWLQNNAYHVTLLGIQLPFLEMVIGMDEDTDSSLNLKVHMAQFFFSEVHSRMSVGDIQSLQNRLIGENGVTFSSAMIEAMGVRRLLRVTLNLLSRDTLREDPIWNANILWIGYFIPSEIFSSIMNLAVISGPSMFPILGDALRRVLHLGNIRVTREASIFLESVSNCINSFLSSQTTQSYDAIHRNNFILFFDYILRKGEKIMCPTSLLEVIVGFLSKILKEIDHTRKLNTFILNIVNIFMKRFTKVGKAVQENRVSSLYKKYIEVVGIALSSQHPDTVALKPKIIATFRIFYSFMNSIPEAKIPVLGIKRDLATLIHLLDAKKGEKAGKDTINLTLLRELLPAPLRNSYVHGSVTCSKNGENLDHGATCSKNDEILARVQFLQATLVYHFAHPLENQREEKRGKGERKHENKEKTKEKTEEKTKEKTEEKIEEKTEEKTEETMTPQYLSACEHPFMKLLFLGDPCSQILRPEKEEALSSSVRQVWLLSSSLVLLGSSLDDIFFLTRIVFPALLRNNTIHISPSSNHRDGQHTKGSISASVLSIEFSLRSFLALLRSPNFPGDTKESSEVKKRIIKGISLAIFDIIDTEKLDLENYLALFKLALYFYKAFWKKFNHDMSFVESFEVAIVEIANVLTNNSDNVQCHVDLVSFFGCFGENPDIPFITRVRDIVTRPKTNK